MLTSQDVANYFLVKASRDDDNEEREGITHLKLQKLVYYAQGFYLATKGVPLFEEDIVAWKHGPVVRALFDTYKGCGSSPIDAPADFDPQSIPGDVRDFLDEVYEVYGQFSAWRLREMTHEDPPWKDHVETSSVIPHEELRVYFKTRLASSGP